MPQSFLAAASASDFLPTWLSHLGLSGQVSMPAPQEQKGACHVEAQLMGRIAGDALARSSTHPWTSRRWMQLAADAAAPRPLGAGSMCSAALYSSWSHLRTLSWQHHIG